MNFKKSDKVWEWLDKQHVGFSDRKKERKSALADSAVEKYKTDFNRMMKMVEVETGKNDPMKVKPSDVYKVIDKLIAEFHAGETQHASFLRSVDDSLYAFKEASKASGVYKREIRLGDKRKISEKLNEEKVFRKSEFSTVLQGNRESLNKVLDELDKMKSPAVQVAKDVLKLEFETGRRISAILRSKVENYDKVTEQFVSLGDKGGKNNESYFLSKGAREILDRVTKDKSKGDMMFKIQYTQNKERKGQDKKVQNIRKQISGLIKTAARRAGVNLGKKTFSSHSCRKGYAKERAMEYAKMTPEQRKNELDRRRALDPKLDKQIDKVLENIKGKFKNKDKAELREFTDQEILRLLVSTDINHSRLDVLRYYLSDAYWEGTGF
ncbi:hypothetical protein ORM40_23785 [Bacillus cereus]|uniref:hypothetical protein n=1 Tax=Bacillus cereus TaxID=1396 RepID=UPI002ABF4CA1|nr:hypothetical protein [Bacillus cereus]MDZ4507699.1 hypothetical protein [Bacillus cereus]